MSITSTRNKSGKVATTMYKALDHWGVELIEIDVTNGPGFIAAHSVHCFVEDPKSIFLRHQ